MELENERYLLPQQRNKSKGIKTYYGGIVKDGVTKWVSLRTKSYSIAMEWYNKNQSSRFAPKKEQSPSIKIEEAMEAYLADLEKVRRSAKGTAIQYKTHLKSFYTWCENKKAFYIAAVTPQICQEYAAEKLAEKTKSTARVRIVILRHFFKWVTQHYNFNLHNPFKGVATPNQKPEPRKFWTIEECEKVIEAASSDECKCWFAFMAFAGLRKEEARFLKMENIKEGKISIIGKGGKFATLPISTRLKEYLNKYLTQRGTAVGLLFPNMAKRNRHDIEKIIRGAAEKTDVSNADTAHFHRFRHSFASNLLRAGRNIKAVQMLMRHENVTLTLNIYGHLLPSDLEKEVEL